MEKGLTTFHKIYLFLFCACRFVSLLVYFLLLHFFKVSTIYVICKFLSSIDPTYIHILNIFIRFFVSFISLHFFSFIIFSFLQIQFPFIFARFFPYLFFCFVAQFLSKFTIIILPTDLSVRWEQFSQFLYSLHHAPSLCTNVYVPSSALYIFFFSLFIFILFHLDNCFGSDMRIGSTGKPRCTT